MKECKNEKNEKKRKNGREKERLNEKKEVWALAWWKWRIANLQHEKEKKIDWKKRKCVLEAFASDRIRSQNKISKKINKKQDAKLTKKWFANARLSTVCSTLKVQSKLTSYLNSFKKAK
jgi:hypothetical protein